MQLCGNGQQKNGNYLVKLMQGNNLDQAVKKQTPAQFEKI